MNTRVLVMTMGPEFVEVWASCRAHTVENADAAEAFIARGSILEWAIPAGEGQMADEALMIDHTRQIRAHLAASCPEHDCLNQSEIVFVATPPEAGAIFGHRCRTHAHRGAVAFVQHAYGAI